jgi:hypothetical protein
VRAERQGGDTGDRDAQFLGHEVGEPGGVQHPRLTPYSVMWEAGGELGERRHLVQRVGHHDHNCSGCDPGDVLGDTADDLGVGLDQVHPAHAGLAW